MSEQPTNAKLHRAWSDAILAENIAGARAETRQELQRLRDLRTTWVGAKDWALRNALEAYLKGDLP